MDSKTIAWVSYLTIIGWVISFVNYGNNKSQLAAFHLRQSLGLMITWVAYYVVMTIITGIMPWSMWRIMSSITGLGGLVILAGVIMGIVAANNGEEKPLPGLGEFYQKMLKGIG